MKSRKMTRLSARSLAMLLLSGMLGSAFLADAAQLRVKRLHDKGADVSYEVQVADVQDLFAYQVEVTLVGDGYEIGTVSEGAFLGGDGTRTLFVQKADSQQPGNWIVAATRTGENGGIDGDGTVALITLRSMGDQANARPPRLRLVGANSRLVDSQNREIPSGK